MSSFPTLPHVYKFVFLYLEPLSTVAPALIAWFFPGAAWFRHQLVPSLESVPSNIENASDKMAIWQLANCYFLLGLIGSLVLRAARNALKQDLPAQEAVVRAYIIALATADVSHIVVTLLALPENIGRQPLKWNAMTHGNITFVVFLFVMRLAWISGVARPSFGLPSFKMKVL